jgi:hypothetical protein
MAVRCLPMSDRHGRDVVVVVAKLAFESGAAGLVPGDADIRITDVYRGDEHRSSLRFPSDAVDEKPGTDVLLLGTAQPSGSSTHVDVSLRVETGKRTLNKVIRVYGPRVWQAGPLGVVPGPSARLAPTPLVYELAFGGADESDPAKPLVDWRNPSGRGVARDSTRLVGQPAPQLEDPRAPLSARKPAPAGFGPIAPHWEPRSDYAGTHDDRWSRERAPVRPVDFDPRHNCCAPADLWSELPLCGGEAIEIIGATPGAPWRFLVPEVAPRICSVIAKGEREHATHLDTLLIDADSQRIELSWRASIAIPKKSQALERVLVTRKEHRSG